MVVVMSYITNLFKHRVSELVGDNVFCSMISI